MEAADAVADRHFSIRAGKLVPAESERLDGDALEPLEPATTFEDAAVGLVEYADALPDQALAFSATGELRDT